MHPDSTSAAEQATKRQALMSRLMEINAEIRGYPQPIARCDAQLGGLVEERERIRSELERIAHGD